MRTLDRLQATLSRVAQSTAGCKLRWAASPKTFACCCCCDRAVHYRRVDPYSLRFTDDAQPRRLAVRWFVR